MVFRPSRSLDTCYKVRVPVTYSTLLEQCTDQSCLRSVDRIRFCCLTWNQMIGVPELSLARDITMLGPQVSCHFNSHMFNNKVLPTARSAPKHYPLASRIQRGSGVQESYITCIEEDDRSRYIVDLYLPSRRCQATNHDKLSLYIFIRLNELTSATHGFISSSEGTSDAMMM